MKDSKTRESASYSSKKREIFFIGVVLMASLICNALILLSFDLESQVSQLLQKTQWLVLVEGSPLETDEVGRFISQLKGVQKLSYWSPEELWEKLQNEYLVFDDLTPHRPQDLPGAWEVRWHVGVMEEGFFKDVELQIRRLPSVLNVAKDESAMMNLKLQWEMWMKCRMIQAMLLILFIMFLSGLVGVFLFQEGWKRFSVKKMWITMMGDIGVWSIGLVVLSVVFKEVPLLLYLGGIICGFIHVLWESVFQ